MALQSMLAGDVAADKSENKKSPHHEVKAKNVIWLFMNGGPSGIDTFDYKPELAKYHGKVFEGEVKTLFPHPGPLMESPFKFNRYGESGLPISEIYSNVAKHADDLCVINSCTSTQLNHVPACYMMNTGVSRVGSPSIGSFATYGLGTENSELPGFVVMMDRRSAPEGGANLWDSGFLPPKYQGVPFRNDGEPVLFLDRSVSRGRQQNRLKFLAKLNQEHLNRNPHNRDLETRIQSFETAYKMQASVPDLMKVDDETEDTKRIYGLDEIPLSLQSEGWGMTKVKTDLLDYAIRERCDFMGNSVDSLDIQPASEYAGYDGYKGWKGMVAYVCKKMYNVDNMVEVYDHKNNTILSN